MNTQELTERQQRIIEAIDGGARTVRQITLSAGISSTSVAAYNLLQLAMRGLIELEDTSHGMAVADWQGFADGWDCAARLAGNAEA